MNFIVFKAVSCFWYFLKLLVSSEVLQKDRSFFVNGAILLQMSIDVIQYPLTIALEGNQYPLAHYLRVVAILWQICAIYKSCQYLLENLLKDCQ
jgi:hypothetical protein